MSLLDLNGKELDREIQKIIRENKPKRHDWTHGEVEIVHQLSKARVPRRVIAEKLGVSISSLNNLIDRSPYY